MLNYYGVRISKMNYNIRNIREKKNISQKQLAEIIGSSQPTVAAYEAGQKTPKLETLTRIADALEVNVLALLPSDITHGSIVPSERERELLEAVSDLNDTGKKKVIEYARDLSKIEEYTE